MKPKIIAMLVIGSLILTGCTKSCPSPESNEEQIEMSAIKASYEKELQDLKVDQVIKIGKLTKQIAAMNEKFDLKSNEYDKLKTKSKLLEKAVFGDIKRDDELYQDIQQDGKIYRIYTEGIENLEDGIVCIIEVLDQTGKTIWKNKWEGIEVYEVASHTPISIVGERIYIVVGGELIAIEKETGKILWDSVRVGYSSQPPLVGNDGTIYTIGQYAPFFSAVSHDGKLKWELMEDDIYGIELLGICNDYLVVKQRGEVFLFDKEGNKFTE